jgi:hypothetical protein
LFFLYINIVRPVAGGNVLLGQDLISKVIVFGAGLTGDVFAHSAQQFVLARAHPQKEEPPTLCEELLR